MATFTSISNWFSRFRRVEEPVPAESAPEAERLNLTPLRQQITQAFNIAELQVLCFDLGIDFEELAGETKSAKVIALINYSKRHQTLPDLLAAVRSARPKLQWFEPAVFGTQTLRLRDRVLQNVQTAWIDGFLKKSLHNEVALELGLVEQPEAVLRTSGIVLRREGEDEQPLTGKSAVRETFEAYGRSLLILGDPGSGKTITLLQLAEELIEEARMQPGQPLPVVLNLSSWAERRLPLADWLVEEMLTQYQVARRISRPWVEDSQLLLLLDGLDEVDAEHRQACVTAVNEFLANYPADIVVCSRAADYEQLNEQLNLGTAVVIQPLTRAEIQRYLQQDEAALQAVSTMLETDSDLYELAQSPLMLNIMTLAYEGKTLEEIAPLATVAARRRHLFEQYMRWAFERRPLPEESRYDQKQAVDWLANLASGLRQAGQSIFHIENLQPSWLPSEKYRGYKGAVGFWGGLLSGLVVALVFTIVIALSGEVLAGLVVGSIFGLAFGLLFGAAGYFGTLFGATMSNKWSRLLIVVIIVGVLLGICSFLTSGVFEFLSSMGSGGGVVTLSGGLFVGTAGGVLLGLFFGLALGLIAYQSEITLVESLTIARPPGRELIKAVLQGFIVVFVVVLIVVSIVVPVGWLIDGRSVQPAEVLRTGLIFGLSFGVIAGLINGLRIAVQTRPAASVLLPNQGIISSQRNALRMCFYVFILIGVPAIPMILLIDEWPVGNILFLSLGLALPAVFLYYGGSAVLHHTVLRWRLARYKILPRNLITFCDEMSDRIILRRVGGGWVFIHRYLLEYLVQTD